MILRSHTFWIKTASILQLFTAGLHSLSFVAGPQPTNDTEKQLMDLMATYQLDLGGGFTPTMSNLMTSFSISVTLLLLFGGILNWYLLVKKVDVVILRGVIGINVLVFGACFITMAFLTFLPPIICTGLIFISLVLAYMTSLKSSNA